MNPDFYRCCQIALLSGLSLPFQASFQAFFYLADDGEGGNFRHLYSVNAFLLSFSTPTNHDRGPALLEMKEEKEEKRLSRFRLFPPVSLLCSKRRKKKRDEEKIGETGCVPQDLVGVGRMPDACI